MTMLFDCEIQSGPGGFGATRRVMERNGVEVTVTPGRVRLRRIADASVDLSADGHIASLRRLASSPMATVSREPAPEAEA